MKKNIIIIILSLFVFGKVSAQKNLVDSLSTLAETTKEDTTKILLLNRIANILKSSDKTKALEYVNKAIEIGKKSGCNKELAIVYKTTGIIYFFKGDFDNAFKNFDFSLETYKKMNDQKGVAGSYINKGIIYKAIQKNTEAGENFYEALKVYLEIDDKTGIALAFLNIGQLYYKQGDYKRALENLLKSRKLYEETDNKLRVAEVYKSIGAIHGQRKETDEALSNFNNSLKFYKELNKIRGQAEIYNNIGTIYSSKKQYEKAIEYFNNSLQLFIKMDFTSRIAFLYYNIGDANNKLLKQKEAKTFFDKSLKIYEEINEEYGKALCYNGIGEYYFNIKNYRKASEYLEKAKSISKGLDIFTYKEATKWLSKTYAKLGNYKNAYKNNLIFKELNDSIFSEDNEKALTTMSLQYEFEKQQEIQQHKFEAKQEIDKLKFEKYIYNFVIAFILMMIITIILIRGNHRKKKANIILTAQKQEIEFQKLELEQRNEEIVTQRDEIENKNIFITKQRDIARKQNKEIKSSITYAKRIQEAVLPARATFVRDIFTGSISDYFILFRPRDIVSGDFYWLTKIENSLIFVAADCTGHGVPGAFMSMLGVSFLNEIIIKDKTMQANEILDKLRNRVISSLHQTGRLDESKDGMDIALCIINIEHKTLQFSGAYNPMFLVLNDNNDNERISILKQNPKIKLHLFDNLPFKNSKLFELKADRMPIGIHTKNAKSFRNNVLKYETGDIIYLFSDGYADQFGGDFEKKLKSAGFRKLLMSIPHEKMADRKKYLSDFFNKWKGKHEQLDDVLVIGMKL